MTVQTKTMVDSKQIRIYIFYIYDYKRKRSFFPIEPTRIVENCHSFSNSHENLATLPADKKIAVDSALFKSEKMLLILSQKINFRNLLSVYIRMSFEQKKTKMKTCVKMQGVTFLLLSFVSRKDKTKIRWENLFPTNQKYSTEQTQNCQNVAFVLITWSSARIGTYHDTTLGYNTFFLKKKLFNCILIYKKKN